MEINILEGFYMNLKFYFRSLLLVTVFFLSVSPAACESKKERSEKANAILEKAGLLFIEEGLSNFYKDKNMMALEEAVKKSGAHLYTDIAIEEHGYLANMIIEYYWVRSVINCYARVNSDNIYEYWVIDRFGGTRDDVHRTISFLITKTATMNKKRKIIHRSNKFFTEYKVSETVINFPADNKSIYRLRPWKFPEAFRGTELEGVEVIIKDGKYVRRKL